ncbi:hypothetical protein [Luteimicrobium subarcticum]|uniref:hypothetical protein n=1 Tax=Luteimicrobium subarcticum TaxID=620910 RepID=UPI001FE9B8C9|nr:hypothetical protein [Luteimicrobium subarcticum]
MTVVLLVIGVLAVVGILRDTGDRGAASAGAPASSASGSDGGSTTPTHGTSSPGGTTAHTSPDAPPASDGSTGQTGTSADPQVGSEPNATPTPTPTGLSQLLDGSGAGHLGKSAPRSGASKGRLLDDFPRDVVKVASYSRITTSSVSSQDDHVQVTVEAATSQGLPFVLNDYRQWFLGGGFTEVAVQGRPGATTAAFRRGDETVSVTLHTTKGSTAYSVFANLELDR